LEFHQDSPISGHFGVKKTANRSKLLLESTRLGRQQLGGKVRYLSGKQGINSNPIAYLSQLGQLKRPQEIGKPSTSISLPLSGKSMFDTFWLSSVENGSSDSDSSNCYFR